MKGKKSFTHQEAEAIMKLIRQKLLADIDAQKMIRNQIRALGFYASDFGIGRAYNERDFLSVINIADKAAAAPSVPAIVGKTVKPAPAERKDSDEHYVIEICDEFLGQRALRQHRFSFLSGDSGRPLPVDAYYPSLELVIEYHEMQHTTDVRIWDNKQTVSGISRALQRKLYDERRVEVLQRNGIQLLVIGYQQLSYQISSKKLLRDDDFNRRAIKLILKEFLTA